MAVGARLRDSLGIEVQSIWSDDGIAFHLPDADAPPSTDLLLLTAEELDELVLAEVGQTALFGARFRENAARALLIPRRRPGERTPLWQQRLKAQGLLQVARKYASFPIVLETYRECLQDVFDLPALKQLLHGLRTRELDLVDVESASASPFASSLLFDYIATYMYEDDTPPAERRAQALSLDRDLLRELLGQEELRELIDADALAEVEASLRPRADESRSSARRAAAARRPARRRVRRGARGDPRGRAPRGARAHRRRRAADRGRGRGPLPRRARRHAAVRPAGRVPRGRPGVAARSSSQRYARGRGPFTTAQVNEWFGVDVEPHLRELERDEKLVRGELRPGGIEREWCDPDVLRRLRRASLAALRREVEPAEQAALGTFLPHWHGIDRRATLREALDPAAGARAAGVALGVGGAAAPRAGLPAGAARPAVRVGRARLGRRRARPRRGVLPRGRAGARAAVRRAGAGGRGARRDSRARSRAARASGPTCSRRPGSRTRSRCPRSGISSGRAR